MKAYKMLIGGKWVVSESRETFVSINPANENVIGRFQKGGINDIYNAVDAAKSGYEVWKEVPAPKRGEVLLNIASDLRKNKERLARLVTMEMGKVIEEARGDVQEAIDITEYMAGEGRRLFGNTTPSELKDKFCMTLRLPLGVCGVITPWNFPTAIPAWKIMPAFICGNSVVFKPASDTPLCAIEFAKIVNRHLPDGVVNLVTGPGYTAGNALVTHKDVRCISFTGSREVGEFVQRESGIKKVGLELGGKNGIIVMDDADIELAVEGVIWGAFGTTGQRCTATSRVIVHSKIKRKFEKALSSRVTGLRLGNGLRKDTDVGPLVNRKAVDKSEMYVHIGLQEGAKLLVKGKRPRGKGFFFEPVVFTNVTPDMRIAKEEIFGPVLSIIEAGSFDEAIDAMNSVDYGLSSAIYTKDIARAFNGIGRIEAGITYVNASTIGSEVHLPFGGIKGTGYGREAGILGIDEFSYVKTVYVDYSGRLQRAQIDD